MAKQIDWERIEADYRAGVKSLREIASEHDVSAPAIHKRAKRDGWMRDLSGRIQAKAEELVNKAEVNASVNTEKAVTDRAIVEANAQAIANVRLAHRKDIASARSLAMSLLQELQHQTGDNDLYAQLGEILFQDGEDGQNKRLDLFNRVLALPGRIDSMKKLAETLKNLIGLEREAYGLKADDAGVENDTPTGLDHFYGGH